MEEVGRHIRLFLSHRAGLRGLLCSTSGDRGLLVEVYVFSTCCSTSAASIARQSQETNAWTQAVNDELLIKAGVITKKKKRPNLCIPVQMVDFFKEVKKQLTVYVIVHS